MGTEGRRRPKFITKRAAIRLTLLLLGGAIINVAVAWGIASQTEHGDWTFVATSGSGAMYTDYVFAAHEFGWPMIALANDPDPEELTPRRSAWMLGDAAFPLLPIWPGFAINTVFYAAILWLVFAVPLAWRRRRRIRRGLCPKCAYDLRGIAADTTACPECGGARTT